jgi:transcriptional regulator with XRE-family HTH domain
MTLRELRGQNKKTLAEVAYELKVGVRAVCRYEQGIRKISLEQVLILAKLYDCTAEEVIEAQLNSCQ